MRDILSNILSYPGWWARADILIQRYLILSCPAMVTCPGRAPDSQIKVPDPESRNREIAKSRKKSHVLAAKSRKSHMSWPGSGLPDQGSGSRIAKSRNREIAKSRNREKVTCHDRAPDTQIRGPDHESRNREIAKSQKNPCPVRAPDRWPLSRIAKSQGGGLVQRY